MSWLEGYAYRKAITIDSTTGNETDLNIRVDVTFITDHMEVDFADIRLTDSDGETLLTQFRESYVSSTSAIFWGLLPSKPLAGKTIYMYYGKPGDSVSSDGENTFPFFDDFSGDLSKWNETPGAGAISVSGGTLKLTITNAKTLVMVDSDDKFEKDVAGWAIRTRYKFGSYTGSGNYISHHAMMGYQPAWNGARDCFGAWYYVGATVQQPRCSHYNGISIDACNGVLASHYEDVWKIVEGRWPSNIRCEILIDDVQELLEESATCNPTNSNDPLFVFFRVETWSTNKTVENEYDWVFVYKLPAGGDQMDDPVIGDEEEEVIELVAAFSGTPTSGQKPLAVQFADESEGVPASWAWTFGDGGTSDEQNPSHSYNKHGVYDVQLTVTD